MNVKKRNSSIMSKYLSLFYFLGFIISLKILNYIQSNYVIIM